MVRRLWVIMAALGLMLLMPLAGAAQSPARIASLRVGLWPEYDQPSLLVIYWGELAPETTYPATISLRMPARIVAPHVVAAQAAPEGNVVEVPYDAVVVGDWRVITFETNGPLFQFEYYDALARDGATRSLTYAWVGDYAVDALSIEFQMPAGAQDQVFSPALPESILSPTDGLVYFSSQFGAVEARQEFTFSAQYQRSQDALTVTQLNSSTTLQEGAAPVVTAPASIGGDGLDIVLLVVVAVVFFLLGAAAMRVAINMQELRRQEDQAAPAIQKRRRRR